MLEGSTALLAGCLIYLGALVAIGWWSRRARRGDSLSEFYLAGRSLGPVVLLFTLFATQYSGNSLSGFPGQTYREGLAYYMSVTFMVAIVGGYLLFAPRLYRESRRHAFITPTDYLARRFASPALSTTASVILAVTLANFLLAQLMAMGHAFAGLTAGQIPYWAGVVGGAVVILVYELMGGMRAVAWTDALQGGVLFLGLLLAALLLTDVVGSPAEVVATISRLAPEKSASPSLDTCALWLSNFLLLGLGAPLYPQAIQRIYAARRLADLKRALATMAFLPHVAITTVVFIGLAGIALYPNLAGPESDQITFRVLTHLIEQRPLAYWPVLIVAIGVLAAIMSTADSCLLSLSAVLTKDFFARWRRLDASQTETQTRLGSLSSIIVMVLLVAIALRPLTTLWNLLVIKFEILIQLSPAFVLGTLHDESDARGFRGVDILRGLLVGLALALGLYFAGHRHWHGLHAGTLGVAANYLTVVLSRAAAGRPRQLPAKRARASLSPPQTDIAGRTLWQEEYSMSEPQTPPPPAQPAQKKGLSPVAWILIGCAGLLLLGALGVGACGLFVAKKVGDVATDFADNPGRAMAEMVVKMNPELDLVATDDDAETITIRNNKTGEEMTVDWSDIENGNFSFGNDEGSFAIDASGGDGAVVTMNSEDGTTTQIFGAGAANDIPDWAPLAPGADQPQGNYSTSDGKSSSGAFSYNVAGSVAEVLAFYERTLTDQGYEVSKSTQSFGGKDTGLVAGENEGANRTLTANVTPDEDGGTLVTVIYSSGN